MNLVDITKIYCLGPEGLKIYPTPKECETMHYKIYTKRNFWEFWKPRWVLMSGGEGDIDDIPR